MKPAHPIIVDVQLDGQNTFGGAEPNKFGLVQGQMMNCGFKAVGRVCKTRNDALETFLISEENFGQNFCYFVAFHNYLQIAPGTTSTTLLLLRDTRLKTLTVLVLICNNYHKNCCTMTNNVIN